MYEPNVLLLKQVVMFFLFISYLSHAKIGKNLNKDCETFLN